MTCACGTPLAASNKSGRCRACAARLKYSDPAARAAMSEAKKRALQDPETRERVARAGAETLRAWHRTTDRDWSAWHTEQRMGWCPVERRAEYAKLRRMRGMTAAEARRIIEETIPGTAAHARLAVSNAEIAMRIRHERQRAQEY